MTINKQSNYNRLKSEKEELLNGSIEMLIKYLSEERIPTNYLELQVALNKVADNYPLIPKILDRLFFDVDEFTKKDSFVIEQHVSLLYDYINRCFTGKHKTESINILIDLKDAYKSLIIGVLGKDVIEKEMSVIHDINLYVPLLKDIMDLYIPSSTPESAINFIGMVISSNVSEFVSHLYDMKWLHTISGINELNNIEIQESELLFMHISDLYSHRNNLTSFLKDMWMLLCSKYTIQRIYEDINEHHQYQLEKLKCNDTGIVKRYIPNDIKYMISDVIYILNKGNVDSRLIQHFYSTLYTESSTEDFKLLVSFYLALVNDTNYALKMTGIIDSAKYNENDKMINHEVYRTLRWKNKNNDDTESNALESYLIENKHGIEFACEAFKKDSVSMKKSTDKIYRAYKSYKNAEEKVDSQITKAVKGLGKVATGDIRTEIIEGKKFSAISLLKKLLGTVAIFSVAPIKGAIALVVGYALKKNVSISERKKIIMELETEIELIEEKINDAQGDNNRQAKYAMMRTRSELKHALERIEYGLEADSKSLAKASSVLAKSKAENR